MAHIEFTPSQCFVQIPQIICQLYSQSGDPNHPTTTRGFSFNRLLSNVTSHYDVDQDESFLCPRECSCCFLIG